MKPVAGAVLFTVVATALACGSSGGSASSVIPECSGLTLPATLHLTVSGYATCKCLDGTFTLTQTSAGEWSSPAITGCPGQTKTAYFKLSTGQDPIAGTDGMNGGAPADAGSYANVALGVTDASSLPGSGNSDLAVATAITCSPLSIRGGGSRAGNITTFCPSAEDENMVWSITP